jgi:transposase
MPNPYPTVLRERAGARVRTSTDTYAEVAARFAIGLNTLLRWVQRARATGDVTAFDKRGGWQSPVDLTLLHRLVREKPDRTTDELPRAYNRKAVSDARLHRSSVLRALQRTGHVFNKNDRDRRNRIVQASGRNARPSDSGSSASIRVG